MNQPHGSVIMVTSGKGGVGKSNSRSACSLASQELGRRVVLMDADLGLANIDVCCWVSRRHVNISDVMWRVPALREVWWRAGRYPYCLRLPGQHPTPILGPLERPVD